MATYVVCRPCNHQRKATTIVIDGQPSPKNAKNLKYWMLFRRRGNQTRYQHHLSDGLTFDKYVDKHLLINRKYTDMMNITTLVLDQSGRDVIQEKKTLYRNWV